MVRLNQQNGGYPPAGGQAKVPSSGERLGMATDLTDRTRRSSAVEEHWARQAPFLQKSSQDPKLTSAEGDKARSNGAGQGSYPGLVQGSTSLVRTSSSPHDSQSMVLDLRGRELVRIPPLGAYPWIRVLDLSGNKLLKLDGLDRATWLEELRVGDNRLVTLQGLEGLQGLKILQAHNNSIVQLSGLEGCTALEVVGLRNNNVAVIEGLWNQPRLRTLDLAANNIARLGNLSACHSLRSLDLSGNYITSLTPAPACLPPGLQALSLANNDIEDPGQLKYLTACTSLVEMHLSGNPFCEQAVRAGYDLRPFALFLLPRLQRLDGEDVRSAELLSLSRKLFIDGRGELSDGLLALMDGSNQRGLAAYLAAKCPLQVGPLEPPWESLSPPQKPPPSGKRNPPSIRSPPKTQPLATPRRPRSVPTLGREDIGGPKASGPTGGLKPATGGGVRKRGEEEGGSITAGVKQREASGSAPPRMDRGEPGGQVERLERQVAELQAAVAQLLGQQKGGRRQGGKEGVPLLATLEWVQGRTRRPGVARGERFREQEAAKRIQAWWVGCLVRKRLEVFRAQQQAAVKIQKNWRGFRTRTTLQGIRTKPAVRKSPERHLGKSVTAYECANELRQRVAALESTVAANKEHIVLLEQALRHVWGECALLRTWRDQVVAREEARAAVVIQRHWRTHRNRKAFALACKEVHQGKAVHAVRDPGLCTGLAAAPGV